MKRKNWIYLIALCAALMCSCSSKTKSIEGFENVEIMRDAYAIEYDCINPLELFPTLMHKRYKGLFFKKKELLFLL